MGRRHAMGGAHRLSPAKRPQFQPRRLSAAAMRTLHGITGRPAGRHCPLRRDGRMHRAPAFACGSACTWPPRRRWHGAASWLLDIEQPSAACHRTFLRLFYHVLLAARACGAGRKDLEMRRFGSDARFGAHLKKAQQFSLKIAVPFCCR